MNKTVLSIIVALTVGACSDSDTATKALRGAGYTQVQITGYRFFTCGERDSFHTGFSALGPTGVPVKGTVCSGWLKGATIRMD